MIKSESSSGLGKELLDYRKRFSITQTQVGRQLGISQVQVSRIEQGEIGIADNLIAKIQKLLRKPALIMVPRMVDADTLLVPKQTFIDAVQVAYETGYKQTSNGMHLKFGEEMLKKICTDSKGSASNE